MKGKTADQVEKSIAGSADRISRDLEGKSAEGARAQSPKSKSGTGGKWDETKEDVMLEKMMF